MRGIKPPPWWDSDGECGFHTSNVLFQSGTCLFKPHAILGMFPSFSDALAGIFFYVACCMFLTFSSRSCQPFSVKKPSLVLASWVVLAFSGGYHSWYVADFPRDWVDWNWALTIHFQKWTRRLQNDDLKGVQQQTVAFSLPKWCFPILFYYGLYMAYAINLRTYIAYCIHI